MVTYLKLATADFSVPLPVENIESASILSFNILIEISVSNDHSSLSRAYLTAASR